MSPALSALADRIPAQHVSQIAWSVVGGIITVGVIEAARRVIARLRKRAFGRLFGHDIFEQRGMNLIYAELGLHPDLQSRIRAPYVKPTEKPMRSGFSIERPISSCEIRAATYLAEVIGAEARVPLSTTSDDALGDRLDVSFVSFGGPMSNYKTRDALANSANTLVMFDNKRFTSRTTGDSVVEYKPGFDYGVILKVHPDQFPRRTWLVCAGVGEWGTSGAAWYLARKWRDVYAYAGGRSFAIIVRVRPRQDESAEAVVRFRTERVWPWRLRANRGAR